MLVSLLEDSLRAANVCCQALDRMFNDQLDPYCRCQVEDDVGAGDYVVHQICVEDRTKNEFEVSPPLEMRDVLVSTGGQVVERNDLIAPRRQGVDQMRTDEAGA